MSATKNFSPEKILLAVAGVVLFLGNFFLSGSALIFCNQLALISIVLLGLYYGWALKDKWGSLCGLLALTLLNVFLEGEFRLYVHYAFLAINVVIGILFSIKTFQESLKNKDWEMFGSLLSLSFLYPAIHHFMFIGDGAYLMVYHFAVAFLIAYIMYYENLWDKYTKGEKSMLMLVLAINVYEVLLISFKNLM